MSYVERRRFLWVLFLAGIALAAAVANSTTLARMSFDELAQKSSAVARLRCQSHQSHWDGGELWTETRFEVVERNKGLLGTNVTVRMVGGRVDGVTSRADGVQHFELEKKFIYFCGAKRERLTGCWAGRRVRSALIATHERAQKRLRRSLLLRILINERGNSTPTEFGAWRYLRFEKSCARPLTEASR